MAQKAGTCEITTLYKGVNPINFESKHLAPSAVNQQIIETLRDRGVLVDGDLVLITKGEVANVGGCTNSLKIVCVDAPL